MGSLDIGVDVDDLRLRPKDGLKRAAELSFSRVELGAAEGELAPSALSQSGRRHLVRYAGGLGLRLSALTADMPALRLNDPRTVDERIQRTGQILSLAADLSVPVVSAATGSLLHPESGEASPIALEALEQIGELADARGVVYALRPTHENAERVAALLDALRCPSLAVCLDPAALVMSSANPLDYFARVPDRILLAYARDAVAGVPERRGYETRLGEGDVDLVGLLGAIEAIEYPGPLVLRQMDSPAPDIDLPRGRETLLRLMGRRK